MVQMKNLLGVKNVWNCPIKVWNRWYIGIFNTKPIQTIYIPVALKYADYMVQIIDWLGVKKSVKLLILGSLIMFI